MKKKGRNKKFQIKGRIWWGNSYLLKDNIIEEGDKRDDIKEKFIINNFPQIETENFVLLLNKYIPVIEAKITDREGNEPETWFDIQGECIGGDSKKLFLNGLKNKFKNKNIYYKKFSELKNVIDDQKIALERQGYKLVYSQSLKVQSRLIVGLGSSHVLETSITLHHIYGVPYIPASALKGVCRMIAFWKIAESKGILTNENLLKKLQDEFYGELTSDKDILKYQLLFGAQNFKGLLLFLDAYLIIENNNTEIFDLDIMNVHYPSYYEGEGTPGDWENPRPIIFLTVKEETTFSFNILLDEFRAERIKESSEEELRELNIPEYAKEIVNDWEYNRQQLHDEIKDLLEKALSKFGVGSKTRLGYGVFG